LSNKEQDFIIVNWGQLSLEDISKSLSLNLFDLLKLAYELKLHFKKTPEVKRRWTKWEDDFLKEHADAITIPQACNLLYRSRYATYQRVKFLSLEQMIGK